MVKAEYILGGAIVFDVITTMIGLNLGFSEGNPLGLSIVIILNTIFLYAMSYTVNLERDKIINIMMYIIAIYRFGVGCWNLFLIM